MTTRKRPAPPQNRPSPNNTNRSEFTRQLGLQRHEPLTADDRADLDAIIAVAERGFRIAVKCRICGHWLSNPKSVRQFAGPKCRKAAAE
jgi:hypothetical protein